MGKGKLTTRTYRGRTRMISKTLPYQFELQAYYDKKKKSYSFPVCGDIIRRLDNPQISESLRELLREMAKRQRALEACKSDQESITNPRLYPDQKSGALWLIHCKKGILADDQGTGKTVTSLAAVAELNPTRTLVICSKIKRTEWMEHAADWCPGHSVEQYNPEAGIKTWDGFLVTNYNGAMDNKVLMRKADVVIIDEAHIIRNRKTRMYKAMKYICAKPEYVFLLTASPTMNEISDYWPLLSIVDPERWGSYWGFAFRFCEVEIGQMGINVGNTKASEVKTLGRILDQYTLSREGTDDLPEPQWVKVDFDMSPQQRKLYLAMDLEMEATWQFEKCAATTSLSQITRLRQLVIEPRLIFPKFTGHSKMHQLPDWVYEWGGQTLIFTQYAEFARLVAEYLDEQGLSAAHLSSKMTDKRKAKNLALFKAGDITALAMSYSLGGEGLQLTAASQAIFTDYPWNGETLRHAYKRVLRRGQTAKAIRFVIFHAKGTVEDHILDILKEKKTVSAEEILRRRSK